MKESRLVMEQAKLKELREHGHYLSVPTGSSMRPMLKSKENVVELVPFTGKLKKYDVAIYWTSNGCCVIHRILKVFEDSYLFYGDNCFRGELVPQEQVAGVAERFYRNGRWISVKDLQYRLYVHLWCDALPLRCLLLRTKAYLKRHIQPMGRKNKK